MNEVEKFFDGIIKSIPNEDPNRQGLIKTPKRAADSFRFLTSGYSQNLDEVINGALFDMERGNMIVVKNIEFFSLCEHHLLPFYGHCHVGYYPKDKVLGLSKIPRIVEFYARRLQMQETLSNQIAQTIMDVTGCEGVGVRMEGMHMCSAMRGVQKKDSSMVTCVALGNFKEKDVWDNFVAEVKY